jgi:hypothetical protein
MTVSFLPFPTRLMLRGALWGGECRPSTADDARERFAKEDHHNTQPLEKRHDFGSVHPRKPTSSTPQSSACCASRGIASTRRPRPWLRRQRQSRGPSRDCSRRLVDGRAAQLSARVHFGDTGIGCLAGPAGGKNKPTRLPGLGASEYGCDARHAADGRSSQGTVRPGSSYSSEVLSGRILSGCCVGAYQAAGSALFNGVTKGIRRRVKWQVGPP